VFHLLMKKRELTETNAKATVYNNKMVTLPRI
jgi:hypothetical protein